MAYITDICNAVCLLTYAVDHSLADYVRIAAQQIHCTLNIMAHWYLFYNLWATIFCATVE